MKWQGKTGLIWFTGIVEDRDDPLFLNRVRVRIYGVHTHKKDLIATPDLPWSQVLMPVTSSSLSGMGTTTHGLIEGSTVMGFWRDGLGMQDPVIMGSFIGQPEKYSRKTLSSSFGEEEIERTPSEGFNDPRLATEASYKKTPDGPEPQHIPTRSYGLTLALDKSPRDQGGDTAINYPRESYIGTSDVNKLARAVVVEEVIAKDAVEAFLFGDGSVMQPAIPAVEAVAGVDAYDKSVWPNNKIEGTPEIEATAFQAAVPATYHPMDASIILTPAQPEIKAVAGAPAVGGIGKTLFKGDWGYQSDNEDRSKWVAPKYPFNHVYESESGHVIEIDDTPDYERINVVHRSGARIEINNKGELHIIAAEGQDINLQGANVNINNEGSGNLNIKALGEAFITAAKKTKIVSEGPTDIVSSGETKIIAQAKMAITALKDVALKSVKKVKIQ